MYRSATTVPLGSRPSLARSKLQISSRPGSRPSHGRRVPLTTVCSSVRPYTIRQGDTLSSICLKRDLPIEDVLALNADLNPDLINAGQTILLPAGKLSKRDQEIFGGISTGYTTREYPVRAGEKLSDILDKRGITAAEFEALNPGVDAGNIRDGQILKLPSDKFTVREQEMLTGSGIMPKEFFMTKFSFVPSLVFGAILGATGAYIYFSYKLKKDDKGE